jgi:four helix bundle protein
VVLDPSALEDEAVAVMPEASCCHHPVTTTKLRSEEARKSGLMEKTDSRKREIKHFRDLEVYQKAFALAMKIFQITKTFPPEERYALTDQIRRSSRAVCSNLAESWRKRKYSAVFCNKLTDAMQEASETQSWLEFCYACQYIDENLFKAMDKEYESVIGMLSRMEQQAHKFCY